MRLLADENIPFDVVEVLRSAGHDLVWIRTEAPGLPDRDVLARATAEGRILITFDKDFGALAFRARLPATCGIILFRIAAPTSEYVANKVATSIRARTDWAGHFSVVEEHRIRMRPLPAS